MIKAPDLRYLKELGFLKCEFDTSLIPPIREALFVTRRLESFFLLKRLTTETDTKYYRLSFTVYKLNHLHMSLFRGMMISGGFAVTKFYCIARLRVRYCPWVQLLYLLPMN